MSKLYFEMNKPEQVLNHIHHDLDWAGYMLAENIKCGDLDTRITKKEFEEFLHKAQIHIIKAGAYAGRMLKAVEDRFDDQLQELEEFVEDDDGNDRVELVLHATSRSDAAKILSNMVLYDMHGIFDESDNEIGTSYIYRTNETEEASMFRSFLVYEDGTLRISEQY